MISVFQSINSLLISFDFFRIKKIENLDALLKLDVLDLHGNQVKELDKIQKLLLLILLLEGGVWGLYVGKSIFNFSEKSFSKFKAYNYSSLINMT